MPKTQFIKTTEGKAELLVPKDSFKDAFHLPVFYNPAMQFNRSVSSIALSCALPMLEGSDVLDGLCSLGARGIRYAKENKLNSITFVDANPAAIAALKKNIKLNKVKTAKVKKSDLNAFFLSTNDHFDFVEIDPFGSPVYFLQNAIRRLKKTSILSITATDLANLAGASPLPCIKHYGARPLKCEYQHEVALRILVWKIASEFAMQDFGGRPLISFYKGHSIKTIFLVEKSAKKADELIPNFGYMMHCPHCLFREARRRPVEKCKSCGKDYEFAGPLWIGKLSDNEFVSRMQAANSKSGLEEEAELAKFLQIVGRENDFPAGFFDLHVLSRKRNSKILKTEETLQLVKKKGFSAEKCHYTTLGIKTDANCDQLVEILKK